MPAFIFDNLCFSIISVPTLRACLLDVLGVTRTWTEAHGDTFKRHWPVC